MKTLLLALLLTLPLAVCGQKDVTKFLGIPVDGSKSEMIRKLKEKGFTTVLESDLVDMEGTFNGMDVFVTIQLNGNKVWRILVVDKNVSISETNLKTRFNTLCLQFANNGKYVPDEDIENYFIPKDENLMYEMTENDKIYFAGFYQLPSDGFHLDIPDANKRILCSMRPVWFKIVNIVVGYTIALFYENPFNAPNGQDL